MKNLLKKLLCTLLAFPLLLLAGCEKADSSTAVPTVPEVPADTAEQEAVPETAEDCVLVSLGDSIAHGYGLTNPKTDAYIALLGEILPSAAVYNFGVDGQNSAELVSMLAPDASSTLSDALASADYVTISIGANNFLGDAFAFLRQYNDFKTNPSTALTGEDITAAFREFNEATAQGLDDLRSDLPQIIDGIRSRNEDCDILFLTCYNPYAAVSITLDWGSALPVRFPALSDACVTQMNDIIRSLSDEYGYTVADVYKAFDGKESRLVCASPAESGDTFDALSLDPHPTPSGHRQIAEVLYELIEGE
ncbi:MAG: SGNH/GDSL hydrolase family protein [Eubacteriales bacterium]